MNNRIIKTFEEFVQIEIEDSDVHLHFKDEEETETQSHDNEVIVDIPMMKLNKPSGEEEHDEEVEDLEKDEYDEEMESENEEETEEEDMAISNLNAIRESLIKISTFCCQGGHLHEWQLQKLAICMDNLSEVARRLR